MTVVADLVLAVHLAFVLFVVLGLAAVLAGAAFGWQWVRNRCFRIAHLVAILFVAAESLIGMVCPLTALENALREATEERSFVGRWVGRLLYYDLPEWVFTIGYLLFAAAVAVTYVLVPPRARHRSASGEPRGPLSSDSRDGSR